MIDWTNETTDRICELIESGKSVNSFAGIDGIPSAPSIYRRMAKDAEFAGMIAIARQAQQEYEMEKCIELADSATPEDWQVKRLQIWARHWRASRMIPKKWGDKITQEITGTNGTPFSPTPITLSTDQERALQELIATAQAQAKM